MSEVPGHAQVVEFERDGNSLLVTHQWRAPDGRLMKATETWSLPQVSDERKEEIVRDLAATLEMEQVPTQLIH